MAQSVVYPMYFSFRTAVLDCALLWYSQLCILCILVFALRCGTVPYYGTVSLYILCILVFALRCWTVPYYGTVSCVYYVFLDIPLIWACRFCVNLFILFWYIKVLDRVLSDPALVYNMFFS